MEETIASRIYDRWLAMRSDGEPSAAQLVDAALFVLRVNEDEVGRIGGVAQVASEWTDYAQDRLESGVPALNIINAILQDHVSRVRAREARELGAALVEARSGAVAPPAASPATPTIKVGDRVRTPLFSREGTVVSVFTNADEQPETALVVLGHASETYRSPGGRFAVECFRVGDLSVIAPDVQPADQWGSMDHAGRVYFTGANRAYAELNVESGRHARLVRLVSGVLCDEHGDPIVKADA